MNRKRKVMYAALAVGIGGTAAFAGTALSGPPTVDESGKANTDLIAKSPRQDLPASPNDVVVMGVWRNGTFHLVKLHSKTAIINTPNGSVEERRTDSSPGEVEAQLPPVDHKFDRTNPTPDQIATMKTAADAEQAKYPKAAAVSTGAP